MTRELEDMFEENSYLIQLKLGIDLRKQVDRNELKRTTWKRTTSWKRMTKSKIDDDGSLEKRRKHCEPTSKKTFDSLVGKVKFDKKDQTL